DLLVRGAVEVHIGRQAPGVVRPQAGGAAEAAHVVGVGRAAVVGTGGRARAALSRDGRAVLEVPDLVGERHVVSVGRPRYPGVLTGRRVHRVERVRPAAARRRGRVEHDLAELVRHAGRHGTGG